MTEEQFFKLQREMQVIDWLHNNGYEGRDIIFIMRRIEAGDTLTNALLQWRDLKDVSDPKHSQPNCS